MVRKGAGSQCTATWKMRAGVFSLAGRCQATWASCRHESHLATLSQPLFVRRQRKLWMLCPTMLAIVSITGRASSRQFSRSRSLNAWPRVAYLCCRQASREKFRHAKPRVCSKHCHVDVRLQCREERPIENELTSSVFSV